MALKHLVLPRQGLQIVEEIVFRLCGRKVECSFHSDARRHRLPNQGFKRISIHRFEHGFHFPILRAVVSGFEFWAFS